MPDIASRKFVETFTLTLDAGFPVERTMLAFVQ
jgi:hypothetical protein